MNRSAAQRDLVAGCLLIVLGGGVAAEASRYTVGTLARMGPGYFPLILGSVLALTGALIVVNRGAGTDEQERSPPYDLRASICVVGTVLAFALLAAHAGFAPATFACVFIAALGDRSASLRNSVLLAAATTVAGMLLFAYALGIPIPIWRWGNA